MMQREISSMMREGRIFHPPRELSRNAHIKSMEEYERLYRRSVEDPDAFWAKQAEEHIEWFKKWDNDGVRLLLRG